MEAFDYLGHPEFQKFVKRVNKGDYLLQQGEIARTMLLILYGQVQLIGEREDGEYIASLLEAGDFLGEKVITQNEPYQRLFSARAETEVLVLELGPKDFLRLEKTDPTIATELLRSMVKVVSQRFDRANFLVRKLRTSNNVERLINIILYFARCSARKFPGGIEVFLTPEAIHQYIDMDKARIAQCLAQLTEQKLLVKGSGDRYLIPNEKALVGFVPKLIKHLAS